MAYTPSQCQAAAAQAGFDPGSAAVACGIFQGESSLDPNVPCTCSSFANANNPSAWLHGYDVCIGAGLTPACGLGQWQTTTAPALYQSQNAGCLGDLLCEMKALFQITNGGSCWGPWGPHVGKPYGYCNTQPLTSFSGTGSGQNVYTLTGSDQQSAGAGGGSSPPSGATGWCKAFGVTFPWAGDCPGGSDAANAPGPLGPLTALGQLAGDLTNPTTWLRAGLVLLGGVVVTVGLAALVTREATGK